MAAGRDFIWVLLQEVFKQMIVCFLKMINIQDFLSLKNIQAYMEKGILVVRVWNLFMILMKQRNLILDEIPLLYQKCFSLWLSDHKQI